MTPTQTIAQLITPPGRGGIAVIALQGPAASEILARRFCPWKSHAQDLPDSLRLGYIVEGDVRVDEAVVCRCGDIYEINIHGGPLVARKTLQLLAAAGATLVESHWQSPQDQQLPDPADLLNPAHPRWNNPAIGREMLAALTDAHSPLVLSALATQWSAGISQLARTALACPDNMPAATIDALATAAKQLPFFLRLLQPCEVVLAGPPNAGKSTLANALIGRAVSIVHEQAGTTRDWVRELALLDGVPVWLTDTAGLWDQADGVDAEAVRRSHDRASQADLVLLASEGGAAPPPFLSGRNVLRIATKCDLLPPTTQADVAVCAQTHQGLTQLKAAIVNHLGLSHFDPAAPMAFTPRQAHLLHAAADAARQGNLAGAALHLKTLLGN